MLCGAIPTCGCSMSTIASTANPAAGEPPTITVTGNGNSTPWSMSLNNLWSTNIYTIALNHLVVTPWTSVTFTSPWVNYGSGYQLAQYRKVRDVVYLRGLVARSPSVSGAEIFVLPVGFRPPNNMYVPNDHNGNQHGGLVVTAAGQVQAYYVAGDQAYWSISGISFSVTA